MAAINYLSARDSQISHFLRALPIIKSQLKYGHFLIFITVS